MYQARLSIQWGSLPDYCFLGFMRGSATEHACLAKVTSISKQGNRLRHLVEVSGEDPRPFINVLAKPSHQTSMKPVSRSAYLGVVETPVCPLYRALSSTSCFLVSETARRDYLQWDLIGESESAVRNLSKKLKKGGARAKLVHLEKINGGRRLTERQEKVLRLAYEGGFFESPHGTSVRKLADALDCSPATLVRLLRKAENKIFAEKFRA